MSNLINPLGWNGLVSSAETPYMIQLPKLPEDLLEAIKITDLAQLEIFQAPEGGVSVNLQVNGNSFALPLTDSLLNLFQGEPLSIPVKINENKQLVLLMPSATNKTETHSEIFSIDISSSRQNVDSLTLSPLKIASFIDKTLETMNVVPEVRQQVISDIVSLKLSLADIGQTTVEDVNTLLQPITDILQQITVAPKEEIAMLKEALMSEVGQLVGHQIPAEVAERINNTTFVKTPLGDTFFESKVKLPIAEPLVLNIGEAILPDYSQELKMLDSFVRLIVGNKVSEIKPDIMLKMPQLKDFPLAHITLPENAEIADMVISKLPFSGNDILTNMYNFYRGAVNKDLNLWLGKNVAKEMLSDDKNIVLAKDLQNFLNNAVKETPSWRIVEMPLFDGNQFASMKVAVKKENNREKNKNQTYENGTRFVVETNFSKLGGFQFDGFSNAPKRKFDLIIRTTEALDEDFCSNIINLFKKSLYDLDYVGTIKINRQEAFINLQDENRLNEGIYV